MLSLDANDSVPANEDADTGWPEGCGAWNAQDRLDSDRLVIHEANHRAPKNLGVGLVLGAEAARQGEGQQRRNGDEPKSLRNLHGTVPE